MIYIYTDGSSKGNPGPGGFGVVVLENDTIKYSYREQDENTTNNREELKAILHAFNLAQTVFKEEDCIICTDSSYCCNICNNWIFSWAKNNWKNSKKKTVENLDLVQQLYNYLTIDFFNCQVIKVGGHQGDIGNELADALATLNNKKYEKIIRENNLFLDFSIKI